MARPILNIKQLRFVIGEREVVLERPALLESGRLYLIRGASGAGKSTLARVLLGLTHLHTPSVEASGQVSIEDGDGGQTLIVQEGQAYHESARRRMAFIPQLSQQGFIDELSVEDNVTLLAKGDAATLKAQVETLAAGMRLWPLPKEISRASGGEKMRLAAVRALLPMKSGAQELALLIADEPTAGLDAINAKQIAALLRAFGRSSESICCVITHDSESITEILPEEDDLVPAKKIIIEAWNVNETLPEREGVVAEFRVVPRIVTPSVFQRVKPKADSLLNQLGALALAPLAFVLGLINYPIALLKQQISPLCKTVFSPATVAFVTVTSAFVAVTLGIFVFHLLPERELLEPLILEDLLKAFGVMVVLVIVPVIASLFATAKNAAADSARLASSTRSGSLDTLAMAGIRIESWALVPMVLSQIGSMLFSALFALTIGAFAGAMTFVARGGTMGIEQVMQIMAIGIYGEEEWLGWLLLRLVGSGFIGGAIAAWFGSQPMRSEQDVARAVHRTLIWSLFAVLVWQCLLILAQFLP